MAGGFLVEDESAEGFSGAQVLPAQARSDADEDHDDAMYDEPFANSEVVHDTQPVSSEVSDGATEESRYFKSDLESPKRPRKRGRPKKQTKAEEDKAAQAASSRRRSTRLTKVY